MNCTLAADVFDQVIEAERYATLAEDNRINLRLLPPPRGRIVDRFGVPLAVNQQNYRVVLVREQARDRVLVLDGLHRLRVHGRLPRLLRLLNRFQSQLLEQQRAQLRLRVDVEVLHTLPLGEPTYASRDVL